MSGLIQNLRDLANHKNHDLTLADEAADRITELEARANYNGEQWAKSAEAIIEQSKEIDRLVAHVRAIAEHHENTRFYSTDADVVEAHRISCRDFALSGLEGK